MSIIHRVIILNQPTKFSLMGSPRFTPLQWVALVLSLALGFFVFTKIPGDWKIGNLPVGFIVGLLIFCGAMVYVNASELKPKAWWKNLFLYRLNLVPKVFYPHIEEQTQLYPDPEIADIEEEEDEGYIQIEIE